MLLIFNILPLLLLTLYSFRCFQKFLNCCLPSIRYKLALQIFTDAFHGCYEDTTHDYRLFASLYLAVRVINLLLYLLCNLNLSFPAVSLLLVLPFALVAKFQPYKCKRSNTVDIVMLLTLIIGCTAGSIYSAIGVMYSPILPKIIVSISAVIPPSYMLFLILAKISSKAMFH